MGSRSSISRHSRWSQPGSVSGYSGWRCDNSQWELLTQCGPGLAPSERLFSVSSSSASRSASRGSGASRSSWLAFSASDCSAARTRPSQSSVRELHSPRRECPAMHNRFLPIHRVLTVLLLGLIASCSTKETNAPDPETPSASAPAKGRAALCEKLQSAVAETLGITVTSFEAKYERDFPLRCIYNPEDAGGPWFEIQHGATVDKVRQGMQAGGGKTNDLPGLGPGAFSANYSFLNWVVAAKGDTQISVAGNHEFSKLQALWAKIAEAL